MNAPPAPSPPPRARSRLRLVLRLMGPVILALVLLRLDDRQKLLDALMTAAPGAMALALVTAAPVLHLKVIRWRYLLAQHGHHYSLKQTYLAVLASIYLGMLTPGRVGDVLRIQYVRHDLGVPYAEGLAVTVMDRVCDLYVLAACVGIGATHFARYLRDDLAAVTAVTVVIAVLAPAVFFIPGLAERVMGRLYQKLAKGRAEGGLDDFLRALRGLVRPALGVAVLYTAVAYGLSYLQGWFIGQSLHLDLSYLDVVSMLAITALLSLMPVSVSGLGVRELFLTLVFPQLGLSGEVGVLFGLLVFVFLYLVHVVAGFIAWQIRPPPFTVADRTAPEATDTTG